MSLAQALTMMLDGAEMGNIDKNLSKEEVENYLKRADKEKKIFSFARKLCAKASSLRMKIWQATGATVIAKVTLENTEGRTRLKMQRRQKLPCFCSSFFHFRYRSAIQLYCFG